MDIRDIMNKVGALLIPNDEVLCEVMLDGTSYKQQHNVAINKVLTIIKAELAVKDFPDSEGAWLRFENGHWIATQIYSDVTGAFFYGYGRHRDYNLHRFKWVKALVPERING